MADDNTLEDALTALKQPRAFDLLRDKVDDDVRASRVVKPAMADDIVERLRNGTPTAVYVIANDAADEIERLRTAGDALAEHVTRPCRCVEAHDGAINETCAPCAAFFDWQEARRG